MSRSIDKSSKRGVKTSYISTTIGVSLVLFMIGLVLGGYLGLDNIQRQAKENLTADIFFKPDLNSVPRIGHLLSLGQIDLISSSFIL